MDKTRFEHAIVVQASQIDINGHANNVTYLQWVQDAAVAHWMAVTPVVELRSWTWVVVRHEIDYKKPAFAGDELLVTTWVGSLTSATTERLCDIHRTSDQSLVAQSRTIWCAIDPVTGRPKRLDPAIRERFLR